MSDEGSRRAPPRSTTSVRSGRDSVLLRTVQRQMEALEERLTSQIARVQHQGDRQIDEALRQLEERMSNSEGNHPRVGRRLAELSGMIKGLTEEMRSQVLRVDALDGRLLDWRHEVGDVQSLASLHQRCEALASSSQAALSQKESAHSMLDLRVQQLERLIESCNQVQDCQSRRREAPQALRQLDAIQEELLAEERAHKFGASHGFWSSGVDRPEGAPDTGGVSQCEHQLADVTKDVEQVRQELMAAEGRLQKQEVHLEALQSRLAAQEQRSWAIEQSDWESRIGCLQQAVKENCDQCTDVSEEVQVLVQKVASQQQELSEVPELLSRGVAATKGPGAGRSANHELQALETLQRRLDDILPKVSEHDRCTRVVLRELVPRLCELSDAREDMGRAVTNLSERVEGVEVGLEAVQSSRRREGCADSPKGSTRSAEGSLTTFGNGDGEDCSLRSLSSS